MLPIILIYWLRSLHTCRFLQHFIWPINDWAFLVKAPSLLNQCIFEVTNPHLVLFIVSVDLLLNSFNCLRNLYSKDASASRFFRLRLVKMTVRCSSRLFLFLGINPFDEVSLLTSIRLAYLTSVFDVFGLIQFKYT